MILSDFFCSPLTGAQPSSMLNIAIAAASLCFSKGGTERASVNLAHEMLARGHQPLLISADMGTGDTPAYPLDHKIPHWQVPADFLLGKQTEIAKLRKFLVERNVDVFLSMQSDSAHMCWALSVLGTGIPFLCSERTDPLRTENSLWSAKGRHCVLAAADAIHELLPAHVSTIPALWRDKVSVIPNAAPKVSSLADPGGNVRRILYLGRFEKIKRGGLLLDAFCLLANEYPDWELVFAGYGSQKENLDKGIRKTPYADRIRIVKPGADVATEYAASSIYCLPSSAEGFPNTVVEAMTAGLPIVGVGDCRAMTSLVQEGVNGFLASAPTPAALAHKLRPLMASAALRKTLGNKSLELCQTLYKSELVYDAWEKLFVKTASHKNHTVMDGFSEQPFACMATLSAVARREYIFRNFGDPMPFTSAWMLQKCRNIVKNVFCSN